MEKTEQEKKQDETAKMQYNRQCKILALDNAVKLHTNAEKVPTDEEIKRTAYQFYVWLTDIKA